MLFKIPLLLFLALSVRSGADRIQEPEYRQWFEGKRLGLITNQTAVNQQLEHTASLLRRVPGARLVALFAPEHGLDGAVQAGEEVTSEGEIHSLYPVNRAPSAEVLARLDMLVYDIQDVGSRFYTFTSTLYESLKAAGQAGVPFVVLDRPNPINGAAVAGPVMTAGQASFVGIEGLPIRYGFTVGELARWLVGEKKIQVDLRVVPIEGWQRGSWFDESGLPWIQPSPNMPTLGTATVYPGFCLIEGTNLSEGRGTTRPFEWLGAPWLDADRLLGELRKLDLPGVGFRSQSFLPTFSKFEGEQVRGIEVHVFDRTRFDPIRVALEVIAAVRRIHPGEFQFRPYFDKLAGNSWVRTDLEQGVPVSGIRARWQAELELFEQSRRQYLIY